MRYLIRILFISMTVSTYNPCIFSQSSFDEELYKECAKEIFLQGIDLYNENINFSKKYSRNKHSFEKFQLTDTVKIKFCMPILTLQFLSHNINEDNLLLADLIDYNYDPYSQIAFIERNNSVEVLSVFKGINQRWRKKMIDNLDNEDFEDYRIPPGYSDSTLAISSTIQLETPKKKFNYSHFKAYLQSQPNIEAFRIYPMKELWALNNGKLKKLSFSKKGIIEEDGEEYFSKQLKKYGIERLRDVIGGGEWEKVIYCEVECNIPLLDGVVINYTGKAIGQTKPMDNIVIRMKTFW